MTERGKDLIREFEGCKLVAYKCPAGVWTIGYGSTFYADGTPVKEGDKIDIYTLGGTASGSHRQPNFHIIQYRHRGICQIHSVEEN